MKLFSKTSPAISFPIDTANPLKPTRAFLIESGSALTLTTTLKDITPFVSDQLSTLSLGNDGPGKDSSAALTQLHSKAHAASSSTTAPPSLTLTRPSRISLSWSAVDSSGTLVAELAGRLWSLGRQTVKFPAGSVHSSHDIPVYPAGTAARADLFVKDSVLYIWDVEDGMTLCRLWRAVDGSKTEVARFVGANKRAKNGLLLVGEDESVDEVVVGMTCVAVLNRLDSFRA